MSDESEYSDEAESSDDNTRNMIPDEMTAQAIPKRDSDNKFTLPPRDVSDVTPIRIDNDGYNTYVRTLRPEGGLIMDVLEVLVEYLDERRYVVDLQELLDRVSAKIDRDWGQNNLTPYIKRLQAAGAVCKVKLLNGQSEPLLIDEAMTRELSPTPYNQAREYTGNMKRFLGSVYERADDLLDSPNPDDWTSEETGTVARMAFIWGRLAPQLNRNSDQAMEVGITIHHLGQVDDENASWLDEFPFENLLLFDRFNDLSSEYAALIDIELRNVTISNSDDIGDSLIEPLLNFHAACLFGGNFLNMAGIMGLSMARDHLLQEPEFDFNNPGHFNTRMPFFDWDVELNLNPQNVASDSHLRVVTLYQNETDE